MTDRAGPVYRGEMPRAVAKKPDPIIASKPKQGRVGGRAKGTKNKKTLEREAAARLAAERRAMLSKAFEAGSQLEAAHVEKRKLAKDVLRDFMELFAGMAAFHQPWPKDRGKNPNEDRAEFMRFAELAVGTAKDLAPFESPRYSAVMIGATVVNHIEVVGGMPDDFAMPRLEAPIEPGTVITADYVDVTPQPPAKSRDAA